MLFEKFITGIPGVSPDSFFRYELTEDINPEVGVKEFGIRATAVYNDDKIISYSVKCITRDMRRAMGLMKLLFENCVCPEQVGDIV